MTGAAGDRPIAVLGATSQIARDFVVQAARRGVTFRLHARRPDAVATFLALHHLPSDWNAGALADFADTPSGTIGGIVNFVGVGDPAVALAMGATIFAATSSSDDLALAYLDRCPDAPYLFLSSGAVYGTDFAHPATFDTPATIDVNALHHSQYYSVAKLHAEARHRAHGGLIVDLRIFNYFSRTLDLDTRFLITDMIRCLRAGQTFETVDAPMTRDYLHPQDFCTLALLALSSRVNCPIDAFSRAPITKRELLALMEERFGLRYRFVETVAQLNATGAKPHYHSCNRIAETIGYSPDHSSATGLFEEISAIRHLGS